MLPDFEQQQNFEVAISIIGDMMGLALEAEGLEKSKPIPDPEAITALQAEYTRLWDERHSLRPGDAEAILLVLNEYGPRVKAAYHGT